MLGRADRRADAGAGLQAQLLRHFDLLPRGLPLAAITREIDVGDAQLHAWLRADPAYVRADINAGRMHACGDLGLQPDEVQALLKPLKPLFGEAGFPIDAPVPHRWYLMLPKGSKLPLFSPPEDALGADLYDHLPQGPEGRRWRSLLNEAQVVLHNHPLNAERVARGELPANSLWFWGGGTLPDHVRTSQQHVLTSEAALAGLAKLATIDRAPVPDDFAQLDAAGSSLVDLRGIRTLDTVFTQWLEPALHARRPLSVTLDFADGASFALAPAQRWRWWRRPLPALS